MCVAFYVLCLGLFLSNFPQTGCIFPPLQHFSHHRQGCLTHLGSKPKLTGVRSLWPSICATPAKPTHGPFALVPVDSDVCFFEDDLRGPSVAPQHRPPMAGSPTPIRKRCHPPFSMELSFIMVDLNTQIMFLMLPDKATWACKVQIADLDRYCCCSGFRQFKCSSLLFVVGTTLPPLTNNSFILQRIRAF